MHFLSDIMVWIFWAGLALIVSLNIAVAVIATRFTFSRRAKALGMHLPVVGYVFGLLPAHFWMNSSVLHGLPAAMVLIATGLGIIFWDEFSGWHVHPFFAFLVGMVNGALFFPN